jgi:hypothetical protein
MGELIMRTVFVVVLSALMGFGVRTSFDFYFVPKARILTNIDEKTPLNHGQKSIDITMPPGVRFTSFGNCGPHWKSDNSVPDKASWSSIDCEVEKFDPQLGGFRPNPLITEKDGM